MKFFENPFNKDKSVFRSIRNAAIQNQLVKISSKIQGYFFSQTGQNLLEVTFKRNNIFSKYAFNLFIL